MWDVFARLLIAKMHAAARGAVTIDAARSRIEWTQSSGQSCCVRLGRASLAPDERDTEMMLRQSRSFDSGPAAAKL